MLWFRHAGDAMCLFTLHKYYTVLVLHYISKISLRNSYTIIVALEHNDVLVCVILDAVGQPQNRPELNHVFLFLFILEIRLPLDTASDFELAPHAFNDFSNGVSVPSLFFVGPGILPIRCRNEARLPELPVRSGGALIFSLPSLLLL